MRKDYEKLFTKLNVPEPPGYLFDRIMFRIGEEQRILAVKRNLVLFSAGLMGSVAAFFPLFNIMRAEVIKSGFLQFLSLVFSDFGIVRNYWQDLAFSLLETIPALNLFLLFGVILAFLTLLKLWIKNMNLIFTRRQLINS